MLMLDSDLEQRIIRVVAAQSGVDPTRITASTWLLHDLNIDGDDAEELLCDFAEVFQVDMAGFDFCRYFREEPNLLTLWFGSTARLEPLTIRQLAYSASAHRWVRERHD